MQENRVLERRTTAELDDDSVQEREVRLTAQRILASHLRPGDNPKSPAPTFWKNIDIDLTGATLIDFSFQRCKVNSVRFSKSTFIGTTWFFETDFAGTAKFEEAVFTGFLWIGKARFDDNAFFNGATFDGGARFGEAIFNGFASFSNATFNNTARFFRATFNNDVWFRHTTFTSDTRFGEATFFSTAAAYGACMRVDKVTSSHRDPEELAWPAGWTVEIPTSADERHARARARLVPVPLALSGQPIGALPAEVAGTEGRGGKKPGRLFRGRAH